MKMELGTETQRQIIIKLRARLKGVLAEHEIMTDDTTHMILLNNLMEIVKEHTTAHTNNTL